MSTFSDNEIKKYQLIIDKTKPGIYELKGIFAAIWGDIKPTQFGRMFKKACLKKPPVFRNIKHDDRKDDNHQTYEVKKP